MSVKTKAVVSSLIVVGLAAALATTACEKKPAAPKTTSDTLKDTGSGMKDAANDAGKKLNDAAKDVGKKIDETATDAGKAVEKKLDEARDAGADAAKAAQDRLVEDSQKSLDAAQTQITSLRAKVAEVTDVIKKTTLESMMKGIDTEFSALKSQFTKLKDGSAADAPATGSSLTTGLNKLAETIKAAMAQLGK